MVKTLQHFIFITGALFIFNISAFGIELDPDHNGALDISYGGTNATSAAQARTNLGAASKTVPLVISSTTSALAVPARRSGRALPAPTTTTPYQE